MNICGTATLWVKIALVLIIVALALHVAGFATDFWQQTETIQENTVYDVGLWNAQNCSGGYSAACQKVSVPDPYINSSFQTVRGLQSIVLIFIFINVLVASLYVATERFREMPIAVFIAVMCFLTVTVAVIAMIVWLAQVPTNHYVGFSFGLCVVAFVLLFLAGILMIPDIRNHQQRRGQAMQKIRPAPRTSVPRVSKYDESRRYDQSYNRRFTPETPQSSVRHYYNPNREPYVRSPPPTYKTLASPEYDRYSITRTDIQTPDVCLGRDGRKPRRF